MDRAPARLPNTASRLIAMAATLTGHAQSVLLAMRCSESDFRQYCSGRKEPSAAELDRLVRLLVQEQRKLIERHRQALDEIRRKQRSSD